MHRRPVVAGRFYPGAAPALAAYLRDVVVADYTPRRVFGVISPHAGYVYSGKVAGEVFSRITVPDSVLLLGPNHTGAGTRASIVSAGTWSTPLGDLDIDRELAQTLRRECDLMEEDTRAHAQEHSLEVQLPFIQARNPNAKIVPIAFMLRSLEEMEQVGSAIGRVLRTWPKPVLVVTSSDMTHYETQESAEKKDRMAIEKVCALDAAGLWETTRRHQISMCGVIPACVMLVAARHCGARRGELVCYTTSGEASGDFAQVVGYAGILIEGQPSPEGETPAPS